MASKKKKQAQISKATIESTREKLEEIKEAVDEALSHLDNEDPESQEWASEMDAQLDSIHVESTTVLEEWTSEVEEQWPGGDDA